VKKNGKPGLIIIITYFRHAPKQVQESKNRILLLET